MKIKYEKTMSFILLLGCFQLSYAEDTILFDKDNKRTPVNLACSSSGATHGARYTKEGIIWQWQNKMSIWCGWMMEDVQKNYSENGEGGKTLEIVYSGTYIGNPSPQVKFLDADGNNTQLINFSDYEQGDGVKTVKIPIKAFNMGNTIDSKSVKAIQFEAGWDSPKGEIVIKSIKIID